MARKTDLIFVISVVVLLVFLLADRVHFEKNKLTQKTLGAFLTKTNQEQLLNRIPPHSFALGQSVPVWDACFEPDTISLTPQNALAYLAVERKSALDPVMDEIERFKKSTTGAFQTLPRVLSETLVTFNRFIQTRSGLDQVKKSLQNINMKLENTTVEIQTDLPTRLTTLMQAIALTQCHWHQSNPLQGKWSFIQKATKTNVGPSAHLFPPREDSPLHLEHLKTFFERAELESPYPLWYQSERPTKEVYEHFIVREQPRITDWDWIDSFESIQDALSQHILPDAQTTRSVGWQLRNLINLIDRAARLTSPEENEPFVTTVTALNTALNTFDEKDSKRWDKLANRILEKDRGTSERMKELKAHPFFKHTLLPMKAYQETFNKYFDGAFYKQKYWIFPRQPMRAKERLETVLNALSLDTQKTMILSPETPWAYFWIFGSKTLQSEFHFQWRQIIVGTLTALLVIVLTLRKLASHHHVLKPPPPPSKVSPAFPTAPRPQPGAAPQPGFSPPIKNIKKQKIDRRKLNS